MAGADKVLVVLMMMMMIIIMERRSGWKRVDAVFFLNPRYFEVRVVRWKTEALVTVRGDIHQWKIEAW